MKAGWGKLGLGVGWAKLTDGAKEMRENGVLVLALALARSGACQG